MQKEFGTIWGVTYIQFTGTALLLFTAFDPWKTLKYLPPDQLTGSLAILGTGLDGVLFEITAYSGGFSGTSFLAALYLGDRGWGER